MNSENKSPNVVSRARSVRIKIIGSLVLLSGLLAFAHGVRIIDPKKVEKTISTNLHVGSDKSEVIHFLNAQHIAHSEYVPEFRRIDAGINRSTIGLMKGHINIQFQFDENGKLLSYRVQELLEFL